MLEDSKPFLVDMLRAEQLSAERILEIKNLWKIHWPPKTPEKEKYYQSPNIEASSQIFERHIVALAKDRLVGYGKIFHRVCQDESSVWNNMALASVCVHPDFQGQGVGRDIVAMAFKHVDAMLFDICLFQTSVPEFYQRFGCQIVKNPFYDPYDPKKPVWWDKYVMAYPPNVKMYGKITMPGGGY